MTRKRPRNEASQGTEIAQFSLVFRARDASRTGWSKKSRLEVDFGYIFNPKALPNDPKSRQGQVGQAFWSQVSSVRSFRPVRLVCLVVWVVPGGRYSIVAPGYGLPAAS